MFKIRFAPNFVGTSVISLAVIIAFSQAGCGSPPSATSAPSEAQPPKSQSTAELVQPKADDTKASPDSSPTKNGRVTLAFVTDPASPKIGPTKFTAHVTVDGKPFNRATVKVTTKMPAMKMDGPSGALKPGKDGDYSGSLDLSMGGHYEATLDVTFEKVHETLTHSFEVTQ